MNCEIHSDHDVIIARSALNDVFPGLELVIVFILRFQSPAGRKDGTRLGTRDTALGCVCSGMSGHAEPFLGQKRSDFLLDIGPLRYSSVEFLLILL